MVVSAAARLRVVVEGASLSFERTLDLDGTVHADAAADADAALDVRAAGRRPGAGGQRRGTPIG